MQTKLTKLKILKVILLLVAVYYAIGAVAHLFGLTLFPFYDGQLYSQYHDTAIALAAIFISMVLFVVARDPVKHVDLINVIIIMGIVAVIFSIGILWKIDFDQLGAPAKRTQTIVEMVLIVISTGVLVYLKPRKVWEGVLYNLRF